MTSCEDVCDTNYCGGALSDVVDASNFVPSTLTPCVYFSSEDLSTIRASSDDAETLADRYNMSNKYTMEWLQATTSAAYEDSDHDLSTLEATITDIETSCNVTVSASCCADLGAFNQQGGFCHQELAVSLRDTISWAAATATDTCGLTLRNCRDEHCFCQARVLVKEFYRYIDEFTQETDNGRYAGTQLERNTERSDVETTNVCPNAEGWVQGSVSFMQTENLLYDTEAIIDYVNRVREIVDDSELNANGILPGTGDPRNAFAFDYSLFALNDQYDGIRERTFLAIAYAVIPVFVILCLFLRDPVAAFVCVLFVFVIETEVYGLMAVCGLKQSDISTINMIMTVGLAVEACGHVARAYILSTASTSTGRAKDAYAEMCVPIANGGFTTFLATVPLAFYGFQYFLDYFFLQYIIILLLCVWNGLVLLPIVFCFMTDSGICLRIADGDEKKTTK